MLYKEREWRRQKAIELLIRASEAVLSPTVEPMAAAILYTAMALHHITVLAGEQARELAMKTAQEIAL